MTPPRSTCSVAQCCPIKQHQAPPRYRHCRSRYCQCWYDANVLAVLAMVGAYARSGSSLACSLYAMELTPVATRSWQVPCRESQSTAQETQGSTNARQSIAAHYE